MVICLLNMVVFVSFFEGYDDIKSIMGKKKLKKQPAFSTDCHE